MIWIIYFDHEALLGALITHSLAIKAGTSKTLGADFLTWRCHGSRINPPSHHWWSAGHRSLLGPRSSWSKKRTSCLDYDSGKTMESKKKPMAMGQDQFLWFSLLGSTSIYEIYELFWSSPGHFTRSLWDGILTHRRDAGIPKGLKLCHHTSRTPSNCFPFIEFDDFFPAITSI